MQQILIQALYKEQIVFLLICVDSNLKVYHP